MSLMALFLSGRGKEQVKGIEGRENLCTYTYRQVFWIYIDFYIVWSDFSVTPNFFVLVLHDSLAMGTDLHFAPWAYLFNGIFFLNTSHNAILSVSGSTAWIWLYFWFDSVYGVLTGDGYPELSFGNCKYVWQYLWNSVSTTFSIFDGEGEETVSWICLFFSYSRLDRCADPFLH